MATLEEVNKAYDTVNANSLADARKKDKTGGLFRDPVRTNKNLGETFDQGLRPVIPKDITPGSVEGTPSKEHNSFNHLNHLEPTCSYKIQYYFTAGILTHAASILRKSAFEDITEITAKLQETAEKLKAKAAIEQAAQLKEAIKKGDQAQSTISTEIKEKPTASLTYDILNIPWKLRVPTKTESALGIFASNQTGSLTDLEQSLIAQDLMQDYVGRLSLTFDAGRQQFACPEKPTNQGFVHIGKYTKPLFLPVVPATSYSGIFGKLLAEVRNLATSGKSDSFPKINTVTALAACRVCVPPKLNEDDGAIPVIAPLLADYVSVVSPPLVYKNGKVTQVPGKNATANLEVDLDDDWKKLIHNGELFDIGESSEYSSTGLVENEIIKHGTSGLTTGDLTARMGSRKDKFVSPFLKRMALDDNPAKAGDQEPAETAEKTFLQLNDLKVATAIKARSWSNVVSDRYNTLLSVQKVKSGTGLKSLSDVPSFHFWVPFMSSKAEDNDGSSIYSYLDPVSDSSLESTEIIYSKNPPLAYLKMGVKFTPFDQYLRGQTELNQDPAVAIDDRVLKYGLGGFAKGSADKYLLPASRLVKSIFESTTGLFSVAAFPKTHNFGKTQISIHTSVIRDLIKTLSRYSYDTMKTLNNVIPASMIKSRSTSGDSKDLNFGINDLGLLGTTIETTAAEETVPVFSIENQSPFGKDVDKTYTEGQIRKITKVELGELVNAELHFGKTLNVKGLEDNVNLQNNEIKRLLTDATIATTPIISTSRKTFVTDIQPGEQLVQKVEKKGPPAVDPDTYAPVNQIEYIGDPMLADYSLYTEDLTDANALNRLNPIDLVGALVGNKSPKNDPTNNSKQGKEIGPELMALLQSSLTTNIFCLLGQDNMIPSLNPDYRPLGVGLADVLPTGDLYDYKGLNQNKIGLFGALGALLKNPEIFLMEHFEDVKADRTALNSLAFFKDVNPDSLEYDITETSKPVPKYLNWNNTTIETVTPNGFQPIAKEETIIFPDVAVTNLSGNIAYEPWEGFSTGATTYLSRFDKFTMLGTADTAMLSGKNAFYDQLATFVSKLIKNVKARATLVSGHTVRIFEEGAFALAADGSDTVTKLTSLINYMKMENTAPEYENSDATFMAKLFDSIRFKINAAAVYTAAEHLKKINGNITFDSKLAAIAKNIKTNRAQLEPLLAGKQVVDADTISQLYAALPQTIGVVRNPAEDSFVVADFPIINILIEAIASFYIYTLVYKKGFPEDGNQSEITTDITSLNNMYKAISTGATLADKVPRYDIVDLSDLGVLIQYALNAKEGISTEGRDIKAVFEKTRMIFDSWYKQKEETTLFSKDPVVTIEIPRSGTLTIPIGIGQIVDTTNGDYNRQRNVIKFVDFTKPESLESFAENLTQGFYFLITKKISQEWLGTTLVGDKVDLSKISASTRNAALMINILDYIGFAFQSMVEVGKTISRVKPVNPDNSSSRERNRINRKLKLETVADYVEDLTKDFASGEGQRAFIVALNDFTNMVRVEYTATTPKLEKMYPVKLKEISPENKNTSLAPKDLIESKSIDLSAFMTPEKTRYMGAFMRPGYGFPDLVEGIGYRCIIKNFKPALYGNVIPKRFAFHSNFISDDASLKMSRMFQNAIGANFQKVIKSSDWTKQVIGTDVSKVSNQIFSVTIPSKMRSSYDNFNPSGIAGAAIFDVEFGYLSTRPLFKDTLSITIPNQKINLAFSGVNIPINFSWDAGFPINFIYRLQRSVRNSQNKFALSGTATATSPVIQGNKLLDDAKVMISSSLADKKTYDNVIKTSPNLAATFKQLAVFGVPSPLVADDVAFFADIKGSAKTFSEIKTKVSELVGADKLRDTGFINATHLTFGGRTFDVPTAGASPYPVINPGITTKEKLLNPTIKDYTVIDQAGHSDESLYDTNALSFMTSPTSIGLAKRRAMFIGFASLLAMVRDAQFVKDPQAVNPYSGFYIIPNNLAYDNPRIIKDNGRDFTKNPNTVLVVYIPDFRPSGGDIKTTVAQSLGVNADNVSENPIAKYYGTGTLLNGQFQDAPKEGSKERMMPTDAMGRPSIKYKKEYLETLLKHLKLWNAVAKTSDDYYNSLNGAFFNKHSANAAATKKNSELINLGASVFKTSPLLLSAADTASLRADIDLLFANFTKLPICLEADILHFTGAAVSYLTLAKALAAKDADKKKIENLLKKMFSADATLDIERQHFAAMDVFSIMAGSRYPADGFSKYRFSLNSSYQAKDNPRLADYKTEVKVFQASQTYMGFSKDTANKTVMFGLGDALGKTLLSPTRNFGKDLPIKDLITSDIPYRYVSPGTKKNKSEAIDRNMGILFNQPAINLFKFSRLWLAYNWYAEMFPTQKLKIGDTEKLIKDVTLEDFTSVNTDYFVKTYGPKLESLFKAGNIPEYIPFEEKDILPSYKGRVITPTFSRDSAGASGISIAPAYSKKVFGPAGIFGTEVSFADTGKSNEKTKNFDPADSTVSPKVLALIWSLFSMKAFMGTDSLGIVKTEQEIDNNTDSPNSALGESKPGLGTISLEKSRIYTDMQAWDKTTNKGKPGVYVTSFAAQGDKWQIITTTGEATTFAAGQVETPYPDPSLAQKTKDVASQNGMYVVTFGKL